MREALEYAINKENICTGLGKGYAEPLYEIIFGAHSLGDPGTTPRKYDMAKAKQLMADAGYASGIKVTIDVNQKFATAYLQAIQADLGKIGINAEINPIPEVSWQTLNFEVPKNNTLRFDRQRGANLMPLPMVNMELPASSVYYPGAKRPDGWDAMLTSMLQQEDPAKLTSALFAMEKLAYNSVMWVPVLGPAEIEVFTPKLATDKPPFFFRGGGLQPYYLFRWGYFTK